MKLFHGITTKGAAGQLNVSISTIKRMVYRGELKPILSGWRYVFAIADIEKAQAR